MEFSRIAGRETPPDRPAHRLEAVDGSGRDVRGRGRSLPQSCTGCPTRGGVLRPGHIPARGRDSPGGGPRAHAMSSQWFTWILARAFDTDGRRARRKASLQKGGDPAAPSGTATLLRLRPNRRSHLRRLPPRRVGPPASGVTDFHDVTGGVYKARERIHRSVADLRLLATPTSRSRVADYDPN